MTAILEADAVCVGEPPLGPLSLTVDRGEIIGLLFAEGVPRQAFLRALAGVHPPCKGTVRFRGAPRVALVDPGAWGMDALDERADIVVFDGLIDIDNGRTQGDAWTRLAAERERGTAIVVATGCVDQAYRTDRVALAMWRLDDFARELSRLSRRMNSLVEGALEVLAEPATARTRSGGLSELQRLTGASRHLLGEARSHVRSSEDRLRLEEIAAELASVSLDDRVFESLLARDD